MMKNLSNDALLAKVKSLVGHERKIIVRVIEAFREIDRRKLYLERGYSSMFSFATEYLGYSEFEAHTRLQAARLARAVPEVSEKIMAGSLNLSVAAAAQAEFRREDLRRRERAESPLQPEEKREVLELVAGRTRREAGEILIQHFGQQSEDREYKFTASKDLERKFELLLDEHSHQNFGRDLGKLIEALVDGELARREKMRVGPKRRAATEIVSKTRPAGAVSASGKRQGASHGAQRFSRRRRASISIKTKRIIWERTGRMCAYVDPMTGKRCTSRHGLEIDHIFPVSRGGTDDPDNLTILCDAHNRWKGSWA